MDNGVWLILGTSPIPLALGFLRKPAMVGLGEAAGRRRSAAAKGGAGRVDASEAIAL